MNEQNEIVLYQPNELTKLEVRVENETVWLNANQMAELFGRDRTVITRHPLTLNKQDIIFMRLLLLSLVIVLISCTPRSVRDAQDVVALADSLREAHLVAQDEYSDSTHLAQAYCTLEKWQWLYPDDFAHACYHYGRMLRDKDNPVSAMQVFLAATHSRTHDYHILGRVYSNIGDMAHLAGEFQLSYEMFECSADMFLKSGDTTTYYYLINDMAFELAELNEKEKTLALLDFIAHNCNNVNIITKTWETKAEIYRKVSQYDSAIFCANQLQLLGNYEPTGIIIKAQSFYRLGEKDSALHYANLIMDHPLATYQNQFNALYILYNGDTSLCKEQIRLLASKREDIRYYEHEPKMANLKDAIYLLNEDLARKPDRRWLYAIIATILILGIVNGCIVYKKRKRHQLLSQQIEDLESKTEIQIDQMKAQMEDRCSAITNSPNLKEELDWHDYDHMCAIVNLRLFGILNHLQSYSFSEKETRLCILVLLKASTPQMVDMIPYAQSGLGKFKYSTARKLGTTTANMRSFLLNLVCS